MDTITVHNEVHTIEHEGRKFVCVQDLIAVLDECTQKLVADGAPASVVQSSALRGLRVSLGALARS